MCDPLVIHWPAGFEARGEVREPDWTFPEDPQVFETGYDEGEGTDGDSPR